MKTLERILAVESELKKLKQENEKLKQCVEFYLVNCPEPAGCEDDNYTNVHKMACPSNKMAKDCFISTEEEE